MMQYELIAEDLSGDTLFVEAICEGPEKIGICLPDRALFHE